MSDEKRSRSSGSGCLYLVGMPVAAICSWTLNHSLLWAIFHGMFWWAYIPYLCMGCGGGFPTNLPW
jgi:hypothetical protein